MSVLDGGDHCLSEAIPLNGWEAHQEEGNMNKTRKSHVSDTDGKIQ